MKHQQETKIPQGKLVKDLVCGMEIDPATAAGQREYEGENYYFCSLQCLAEFNWAPSRLIHEAEKTANALPHRLHSAS